MMQDVAVIGGGASGLVAAISAARNGARVTVLERADRVGKKLLATGNGRCNFTNINASERNYHGAHPAFVSEVVHAFWVEETLQFFEELGILARVEEEGKIYPYSGQASAVLDVLRMEAERVGVQVRCGFEARLIQPGRKGFCIESYDRQKVFADKVIVAAGGKASPNLGSNGSGYPMLERLGHRVTALYPALVQIKTDPEYVKGLKGIKFNGTAVFYVHGTEAARETGEILFTEYGLSGPPIFKLSRLASVHKDCEIVLDLMPEYDREQILALLKARKTPKKTLETYLVGMLHKKLALLLLKSCGLAPLSRASDTLSDAALSKIAAQIKGWRFHVRGTMSWNNAQVTAGGIDVRDVDAKTFESKLVRGLYITGELLDIDGDCGGYNLQWAWSSGFLAGAAAARGGLEC